MTSAALSLSGVAFHIRELIEDRAPRFVAVIFTSDGPKYGYASTSFLAIVDALGMDAANDLVADMKSDPAPYAYDETFGRDVWRAWSDKTEELLAILVRV